MNQGKEKNTLIFVLFGELEASVSVKMASLVHRVSQMLAAPKKVDGYGLELHCHSDC